MLLQHYRLQNNQDGHSFLQCVSIWMIFFRNAHRVYSIIAG